MEVKKYKAPQVDKGQKTKKDPAIICVHCGHIITFPKYIFPIFEKVEHQFLNPNGLYYTIHCFKEAPGCCNTGHPSL